MWSTDWPGPNNWIPMDKWVEAIKEPKTKVKFSPEEKELMLGKAAQKCFGIPDDFHSSAKY